MDLPYPLSAVDLTSALIRLASPDRPGAERAMADGLAGYLGAAGFAVEVDEFAPGRFNLVARVAG